MAMKFRNIWFAMRERNGNVLPFNSGFKENAPHSEIHLGVSGLAAFAHSPRCCVFAPQKTGILFEHRPARNDPLALERLPKPSHGARTGMLSISEHTARQVRVRFFK